MDAKACFVLGNKLIGLYCLVLAIRLLFQYFPAGLVRASQFEETTGLFQLAGWISIMVPALMMILGLYLIKDGRHIQARASEYGADVTNENPKEYFMIGIMLYGVYLVVRAIPDSIGVVSNVIVVLQVPPYMSTEIEMDALKSKLLPTLSAMGLGILCFFKGRYITQLAFRES